LPAVPDVAGVPSAEELAALPHDELVARLAEAYRVIAGLTARVELLERRAGRDSSTSSKPPSSDGPYKKKPRDRSLRERGKRRPGKQPGEPGTTMKLVNDPDHRLWLPPWSCRVCGTDLADAPVIAQRRHQVTDIGPAPPPAVTEYVAQAKQCLWCEAVSEGQLPAHVRARASFGPETHAQAAKPHLREPHPGAACRRADVPDGRRDRLRRLGGRSSREGRCAGCGQRVHRPGERAAEGRSRCACGRDPGPRGGRTRYVHLAARLVRATYSGT
jgi:uncharacterized protein DUF6444